MKIHKIKWLVVIAVSVSNLVSAQELLINPNWEKIAKGQPASWRFFSYSGKSKVELSKVKHNGRNVAEISSNRDSSQGYIGQMSKVNLPAGTVYKLSGWYKTKDFSFADTKGMLRLNFYVNYGSKDPAFPKKSTAVVLKPSGQWKRFEAVKSFPFPVKSLFSYFLAYHFKGQVSVSNLSIQAVKASSAMRSDRDYIWREAEKIFPSAHCSNWGNQQKGYYSGKGGVIKTNGKLKWGFSIKPVNDADALTAKKRKWFVWLRLYGYRQKPEIKVLYKNKLIASFKTRANEKVDAKGSTKGRGNITGSKRVRLRLQEDPVC